MPKIFSEHERSAIQASMLEVGAELLKRKGIKQVSVEDIAKGVHIAKGTFYSFYHSREELLWDVIQFEEQHIVDEILFIASQDFDLRTKVRKILYEVYLKDDSIVFYLPEMDISYIMRKLPPEVSRSVEKCTIDINRTILAACDIDTSDENVEILTGMLNALQFACTNQIPKSKSAKRAVLDILVEAIINYFCKDKPITCLKSGI